MATKRPPIPASSLVERKKTGVQRVRKTVYLSPEVTSRLRMFSFEHGIDQSDVMETAVLEYLERIAPTSSKRKTIKPPASSAPATPKSTTPPRSRRA